MKKMIIMLSYVLMAFFVVSCSNDNEETTEIQNSPYFTDLDISNLQLFKSHVNKNKEEIQPTIVKAIKRNRAKTRGMDNLSDEEFTAIRSNLSNIGEEAISLFESLGISKDELEKVCPLDQTELYGMVALEIVDALEPDDVLIDGPDQYKVYVKVDWGRVAGCLAKTLGLDDGWDFVNKFAEGALAGYATKEALKKVITGMMETAAKKGALAAGTGGVMLALFVAEWVFCYYDWHPLGIF